MLFSSRARKGRKYQAQSRELGHSMNKEESLASICLIFFFFGLQTLLTLMSSDVVLGGDCFYQQIFGDRRGEILLGKMIA